ncbi:MAG: DUF4476 domain-containing protein [Bacteroidia bacterium]
MKKALLLLLAVYATVQAFAQTSNLVFYSSGGERFYVILQGIRQNEKAETNVKVTGLPQPYYEVKIIFEDKALGEIKKMLNFNPGTETVFNIMKNNKGEFVCRWQSEVPLAQAAPPAPGQNVMVYSQTAPAGNITYTEQTTTTVTTGVPGASANVNMNVPGVSMNVNISDPFYMPPGATTTTTYQTTTTTTSSNNYSNNNYPPQNNAPAMSPGRAHIKNDCWMGSTNSSEFDGIKKSISSNGFDETRLSQAKSIVQKKCLTSNQVKEICQLFGFEDTMLDFAKFAYDWVYDQDNYYVVNDVFGFESSKTELNSFINGY